MSSHSHNHQLSRVQEAIAAAKQETDPHKKAVLARILEQRIRLKGHEIAKEVAQENTARANLSGFADANNGGRYSTPLTQFIDTASYGSSLLAAGRNFAYKHPVSVGLILGACVVLAPRSLIRTAIQTLPFLLRIGR